jgi:serine/threonine protein kinase
MSSTPEINYVRSKILNYGWISEEDWNIHLTLYSSHSHPDLLKWLIQKKLLSPEQVGYLQPLVEEFRNRSPLQFQETIAGSVPIPVASPSNSPHRSESSTISSTPTLDISPALNPDHLSPTLDIQQAPSSPVEQKTLAVDFSQESASYLSENRTLAVDFSQESASALGEHSSTLAMESDLNSSVQTSAGVKRPPHATQTPASTLKETKQFGPYEILQKLGEGGMGQVYQAKHTFLDKVVALKVLAKHLASNPQFIERFFREAKASGKMEHPNIIRSLDAGEINGTCYLALEFVEGKSLATLMHEGAVNQTKAIKYLIGICKALEYAENLHLVHRDIKPDNIMVTTKGVPKLLDMGLTKEVGDTTMTKAGQILGTPDYISPEQAKGNINIDIRSDIYSLGATFYHVLTGQRPFSGGESILVLLNKHISEKLKPLQQVKPHLDSKLCAIIEKMMEKDPRDRYQHPRQIIEEIEKLISSSKQGDSQNQEQANSPGSTNFTPYSGTQTPPPQAYPAYQKTQTPPPQAFPAYPTNPSPPPLQAFPAYPTNPSPPPLQAFPAYPTNPSPPPLQAFPAYPTNPKPPALPQTYSTNPTSPQNLANKAIPRSTGISQQTKEVKLPRPDTLKMYPKIQENAPPVVVVKEVKVEEASSSSVKSLIAVIIFLLLILVIFILISR